MKYLSTILLVCFISCNQAEKKNNEGQTPVQQEKENSKKPSDISSGILDGCYRRVIKRDTVLLKLKQSGKMLKGTLIFDNYQIDGSRGTVQGRIEDDKILLWYEFNSEGEHSVMEQVFLRTADGLIRATGPMVNKGDTMMFTDYSQLNFDQDNLFRITDCDR